MSKAHNIFISHYGEDDEHVQRLKRRLIDRGNKIRNSSIDSTKHNNRKPPSDAVIARLLNIRINWAKTFICLIGEDTHERFWVNHEIEQAYFRGKTIVGIYKHGCANSVEIPNAFKLYGGSIIGWNSLHKLEDIMNGKTISVEAPDSSNRSPIYSIKRIPCSSK